MKNYKPAIFLDRDGTLIEDMGYISTTSKVHFFNETIPALNKLKKKFLLFIVTNQSGISKGFLTKNEVNVINIFIENELLKNGITITKTYTCPHDTMDNCNCKKPKTYFLEKASLDYNIDLAKSFVIGDHPHDVLLAHNAGAKGIYLLTGHGKKHFADIPKKSIVMKDISEAANFIYNNL